MNSSRFRNLNAVRIQSAFDFDIVLPDGFSFFEPYLQLYVKEVLETGGEAYVSKSSDGALFGLFIFDEIERTGAIFTQSREVFDYFYTLKRSGWIFSELRTEHHREIYDIYTLSLENHSLDHRFSHEISMGEQEEASEIESFMVSAHQGMNRRWVRVALANGEKCFLARLDNKIAGAGWASIANGVGRLHSLFVRPELRGAGIGKDILHARLLWLKLRRARMVFSEISRDNIPSSRIAITGQMKVSGQVYQYHKMALEE